MAAVTSPESTPQPRVYFQTPPGTEEEVPQKQGRVTVKYDRKELRRRLNLEEWIVSQLMTLYDCEVGRMHLYLPVPPSCSLLCCEESFCQSCLDIATRAAHVSLFPSKLCSCWFLSLEWLNVFKCLWKDSFMSCRFLHRRAWQDSTMDKAVSRTVHKGWPCILTLKFYYYKTCKMYIKKHTAQPYIFSVLRLASRSLRLITVCSVMVWQEA